MAKAARNKLGSRNNPAPADALIEPISKAYIIKEAAIKDDYCNYVFEVLTGVGVGSKHKVDGNQIIEDDMRFAFGKFNVHLACIDDVFKLSNMDIEDIDKFHDHEITSLYKVTGFKIKGSKENESIVLIGNKYVSTSGGRIELETPKIPLDSLSSYKWYNELKEASDNARLEVELYSEGKYVLSEDDEDDEDNTVTQLTIGHAIDEAGKENGKNMDDEFEKAKV